MKPTAYLKCARNSQQSRAEETSDDARMGTPYKYIKKIRVYREWESNGIDHKRYPLFKGNDISEFKIEKQTKQLWSNWNIAKPFFDHFLNSSQEK